MAKKSTGTKKRVAKKPAKKAGTVNKAQEIRDAAKELGKNPRPRDVIAALAAKGISVSSPQVSSTLKAAGLRKGRRKPKVTMTAAVPSSNGHGIDLRELLLVKKLSEKLGTSKLKELVGALERLA